MLGEAEQTLPASGASAYRVAELRAPVSGLRNRRPKPLPLASKTSADPSTSPSQPPQPKVAILLCTYQGQHYLEEQLMSFQAQSHPHWVLHVSDDGSSDDTRHILRRYQALLGADKMAVKQGPLQGFASNFLSLTAEAHAQADYYAYSDQDDVWEADKLARAVAWLQTVAPGVPALYCSRTRIVDAQDVSIGLSPLFEKPPGFANALVQNIGGGNTMVFNEAARKVIATTSLGQIIVSHDWWTYIIISGLGGVVHYDQYPTVRYRQHESNLIGTNGTWTGKITRLKKVMCGRYREWNAINIAALKKYEESLTQENKYIFNLFIRAREASWPNNLFLLNKSNVYRQSTFSQILLYILATLKKI